MPRYFFHLSFGDRFLPDEEGVELASRSAARQEALAVVRELSGSMANRWAGWFLRVADRRGQFLSLPLGHPALTLVSNDPPSSDALTPSSERTAALTERAAAVFAEALALHQRTAELCERNRQLRAELSSALRSTEAAGNRARQLTAHARHRIAARRDSPPDLVLIPGGSDCR